MRGKNLNLVILLEISDFEVPFTPLLFHLTSICGVDPSYSSVKDRFHILAAH